MRFVSWAFTICHVKIHLIRLFVLIALTTAMTTFIYANDGPTQGSGAAKIGSIHIKGLKKFTAEQVIAAMGLKPGQVFDLKALDAGAERLGKSGAFPDVAYSYVPQGGLIAVDFKVEETAKFRECVFDNFVWLTKDEIQAGLKKDVPLFIGILPEAGQLLDDVSQALENLSKEKGIPVKVTRRVGQQDIFDKNWRHLYSAQGADVKTQSISFTGILTVKQSDLQKEASGLIGRDYSLFQSDLFGTAKLLPYYHERGFLLAKADPQPPKIVSHTDGSLAYLVEVVYAVTEGNAYRWEPAEWIGDTAISPSNLEAATAMKPNEIANGKKIEEGWAAIHKEYLKIGYIEETDSPEPVFDTQSLRVHYRVMVYEGAQYHMGSIAITGVPQKTSDRLKDRWRLKPGDIYDGLYTADFVKKEVFPAVQGGVSRGIKVNVQTFPNREQHIMDVTVNLE